MPFALPVRFDRRTAPAGAKPRRRLLLAICAALALSGCQSADLSRTDLTAGLLPLSKAPALSYQDTAVIRGYSAIVVDGANGRVLFADDADGLRHPASLSKLMTLYLLFEAIEEGKVGLDDGLVVSAAAAAKPPSKLGLQPGSTIRVRDAIPALAVKSSNDVASVVAENLGGGSETVFAAAMTRKARELGMMHTRFVNPSGLPDPQQISTARDMAVLGIAVRRRFPQFASVFKMTEFQYAGRTYKATNKLLGKVDGVDGMKTGYVRDSGFNLVASATRGRQQRIVVVIGGETSRGRDARVVELLERSF